MIMADDLNGAIEQIGADVQDLRSRTSALETAAETWQTTVPLTDDWRADVDSSVTAYRTGNVVTVAAWRLATKAGVNGDVVAYTLPSGYRPPALFVDRTLDSRDATVKLGSNNVATVSTALDSHLVSHHSFTFVTGDPTPPAADALTWDGFENYQNVTDDDEEDGS